MKWQSLLIQGGIAQAAMRFGCSSLSIQRLDPLVEPGNVPSAHVRRLVPLKIEVADEIIKVHQIVGKYLGIVAQDRTLLCQVETLSNRQ